MVNNQFHSFFWEKGNLMIASWNFKARWVLKDIIIVFFCTLFLILFCVQLMCFPLFQLVFAVEKSMNKKRLWNFTDEEVSERVTLHFCSSTKKYLLFRCLCSKVYDTKIMFLQVFSPNTYLSHHLKNSLSLYVFL